MLVVCCHLCLNTDDLFFFKDQSKEPAYGADVLRFWSAQAQLQKSVMVGPSILEKCNEELFKVL